ncbi:aminotransferase class I/II-fold pyridoxal phosphate-dependent enzyme [Staphylococcus auricularis]|uniref:Aminotransferase n=1 Tax=Staphylococcus auricularis TaxID=29379 RepID=A0AAW7MEL9_9STAP|nr:aminotransferase class I/II-fold pyridoxal phosphate-dependent enzyme [Staphylococcus auricularis]MDC6326347.1 aminotransferase class I/II-fold pyridoxal phosphate-dependent enzyme [Staphylococcus auricularis]MDN4533764.1 aminotransferase class I/II-fold pyridoxal phosphate-dependent enzyme [Staphylococcus auricularis]HJE01626.1 aminotransferase class I/II-fold pyridoxal phosphate-dependent enzyme [Staphylococcus auricularis]
MKLALNTYSKYLRPPSIRQFSNRMKGIDDCINLTVGQPDFPMPDVVKQAYITAIEQDQTAYSHNKGLLETREAISQYFESRYGFTYDSEEEIIVTNGASEALDTALRSILNEGDEVLIPAPSYAGYIPLIEMLGATPVFIDTSETNYKITSQAIEHYITSRTKAILLNYPSNPTGVVLSYQDAASIARTLQQHEIFILSDEIYAENTFSKPHVSFAQFPEIRDQLLLISGLSKSHAATGIRIGFLLGPSYLIEKLTFAHAYNCICANVPAQYATIAALKEGITAPQAMNEAYIERKNYLSEKLQALGFQLDAQPEGAFYIFPNISYYTDNDFDFCVDVLEQAHVAMVPGSSFTDLGKGHVRISYAYDLESIKEGMDRLERYLSTRYPTKFKNRSSD